MSNTNQRSTDIRRIVDAAGIKLVRVSTPRLRGRWGWVRIVQTAHGAELNRSRATFRTDAEAYADAYRFYGLPTA